MQIKSLQFRLQANSLSTQQVSKPISQKHDPESHQNQSQYPENDRIVTTFQQVSGSPGNNCHHDFRPHQQHVKRYDKCGGGNKRRAGRLYNEWAANGYPKHVGAWIQKIDHQTLFQGFRIDILLEVHGLESDTVETKIKQIKTSEHGYDA